MYKRKILIVLPVMFLVWTGCNLAIGGILSGDFPEKIWLHRCNSLEKLHELDEEYSNVEVDVVFRRGRRFDVTHDADTSFNLPLDPYFAHMDRTDGKIWLDIKNLKEKNKVAMLAEIDRLVDTHHIGKDELIIESGNWEALRLFTDKGYYTSYYVPFDKPHGMSGKELDWCIARLRDIVDSKSVRALSFPGWWYPAIKKRLERPVDLLTWRHRTSQFALLASPIGRRMLGDGQLKVILVKDKGSHHR